MISSWKVSRALVAAAALLLSCPSQSRSEASEPAVLTVQQRVLPLPGKLDETPVLNSNSPEVIQTEGILLSTFSPEGKAFPQAHLNYPVNGRFDLFFHHIANGIKTSDSRTVYLGFILQNESDQKTTVRVLRAASYLSRPDAPFKQQFSVEPNNDGKVFAGPGDRVTTEFLLDLPPKLRRLKQSGWKKKLVLKAHERKVLFVREIPVRRLMEPLNGRSGLVEMETDGPVTGAMLASFGHTREGSSWQHPPKEEDWIQILKAGDLAGPRDRAPSVPGSSPLIYGRVAGVQKGARWSNSEPKPVEMTVGDTVSFPLSSLTGGTFGTQQVQTAPLVARYADTAYEAHGNYAVEYDVLFKVTNTSEEPVALGMSIQTPLKRSNSLDSLQFYATQSPRMFFRGTARFMYEDDKGPQDQAFHFVEKQGEPIPAAASFTLAPHETKPLRLLFLYPPDATPPQVFTLTSRTLPKDSDSK